MKTFNVTVYYTTGLAIKRLQRTFGGVVAPDAGSANRIALRMFEEERQKMGRKARISSSLPVEVPLGAAVMKVFVIMGNDFPDCVLGDEAAAEKLCKERMDAQKAEIAASNETWRTPRIYWRSYPFEVQS